MRSKHVNLSEKKLDYKPGEKRHIMGNTLITISRQHGSGGTKVAQILAEKLGIWYYNREIPNIWKDLVS